MSEFSAGLTLPQQTEMVQAVARASANPAQFKPIYDEYFPRIYRYCVRRARSSEDAEDLASLIFSRALAGLESYRGGSFPAWLFRIAHNSVANYWRDFHGTVALEQAESAATEDGTLGRLIEAEERQQIARLMAALPEDQRELLALRMAGGLSAKEIGQVIGKSEGAVRVAIHRTIQHLRSALREETR
jgi:RNA polymerase sigma-70 factor (ECF subfamily)